MFGTYMLLSVQVAVLCVSDVAYFSFPDNGITKVASIGKNGDKLLAACMSCTAQRKMVTLPQESPPATGPRRTPVFCVDTGHAGIVAGQKSAPVY